jgi:D-cysteine desulfhydrase family pyridoxal phosphate-dependent enzyme
MKSQPRRRAAAHEFLQEHRYEPPSWAAPVLKDCPTSRIHLTCVPTPVHKLNLPADFPTPDGFELFMKRDDMSGGVELCGNKTRKLEFLLAEAKTLGADCIVTIGGQQSNHCRTTAAAARILGLETFLILRIEDPSVGGEAAAAFASEPGLVGNLLVDRLLGSQVRFVTKQEYGTHGSTKLLDTLCDELRAAGRRPYSIPVGGSGGSVGTWGYVEAVAEMQEQDLAAGLGITDVAFACGSGGTAAGVAVASKLSGWGVGVHGYGVCDSPAYFYDFLDEVVLPGMGLAAEGKAVELSAQSLLRVGNAKGQGYAVAAPADLAFISRFARATGVVLDPCYTGKAMRALLEDMRQAPELFKGRRVLFIHTGGLLGTYEAAASGRLLSDGGLLLRATQRLDLSRL